MKNLTVEHLIFSVNNQEIIIQALRTQVTTLQERVKWLEHLLSNCEEEDTKPNNNPIGFRGDNEKEEG